MSEIVKVIVVDDNLNDAELMISQIKSLGYGVRPKNSTNEESFRDGLESHHPDLILFRLQTAGLTLTKAVECIQEAGSHCKIITVADSPDVSTLEMLKSGAVDCVQFEQDEHLKFVLDRTIKSVVQWRQLKKANASLRETEKRCSALLESSRDAIGYIHDGMHIHANQAYLEFFGFPDIEELEGMPVMDMIASAEQNDFKKFLRDYMQNSDGKAKFKTTIRTEEDAEIAVAMEFSDAKIDGEACTQLLIRQNTNDVVATQIASLQLLATQNLESGLLNRSHFLDSIDRQVASTHQGEGNSSVLLVKISNFKKLQGQLGVNGADTLFNKVATRMKDVIHAGDEACAFNTSTIGLISNTWKRPEIEAYIKDLIDVVAAEQFDIESTAISCGVTIGASPIDENTPDPDVLLERAQHSLEKAITDKISHVIYQPSREEMSQRQLDQEWADKLRAALTQNKLKLAYQPVISLAGDQKHRFNVFMRLHESDNTVIAPAEFMGSAERVGIAKGLDRWVLHTAIKSYATEAKNNPNLEFHIKLSETSISTEEEIKWMSGLLNSVPGIAKNISVEVKASSMLKYLKQGKVFFDLLEKLGTGLIISDFGSALDPFMLTKHIPARYVKIDPAISSGIMKGEDADKTAFSELVQQARENGNQVIIQQVEDAQQLSTLWGYSVDLVQGNFLSKPSEALTYNFDTLSA